LATDLIFVCQG